MPRVWHRPLLQVGEAVSADPMGINSSGALAIQACACLWLRDAESARTALTGMKAFRGRPVAAARLTAEAGLAALEGRVDEAAEAYREAIEAWRALECTLDLALCELARPDSGNLLIPSACRLVSI